MRRSCIILETESNIKIIEVSDNYAISSYIATATLYVVFRCAHSYSSRVGW